ncbi:MAG: NAD(+) diphosphatase [Sedimenticola sp.]|nr:NAD(+) diphosphatase [Sedimenticola sp.]
MNRQNFYTSQELDRLDRYRDDAEWLARILGQGSTRLLPVWRNRHPVDRRLKPLSFPADRQPALLELAREQVLLGSDSEGTVWVALDLSHLEQPAHQPSLPEPDLWRDLRAVGPLVDSRSAALLAQARAMLYWHRQHRFCGACGSRTEPARAGHLRICSNPDCGRQHHPRTDPAVIMLVHDGDHCLLGRQPTWPPGMQSNLAGFVEPGESLENAVAREVWEEAGIRVGNIRYFASQPWPFPSSIMLGFFAGAKTTDIAVDGIELESAGWYHRDRLIASPEDETFRLPRRDSISWRLIETWMRDQHPR